MHESFSHISTYNIYIYIYIDREIERETELYMLLSLRFFGFQNQSVAFLQYVSNAPNGRFFIKFVKVWNLVNLVHVQRPKTI
jgi:hypothetical protein